MYGIKISKEWLIEHVLIFKDYKASFISREASEENKIQQLEQESFCLSSRNYI